MTVPPIRSSLKDNRGARRTRAAPRAYRAGRSARVENASRPATDVLPSEWIDASSAPAATSMEARSSGRGASTTPPPASHADVRASPSALVSGASVSGA